DIAFLLLYSERPARTTPKRDFGDLYAAERDHVLSSVKGRVTKEIDCTASGQKGREFQVELDSGGNLIGQVYMVKGNTVDRLYVLVVAGASVKPGEGAAAKYLGSFEIH